MESIEENLRPESEQVVERNITGENLATSIQIMRTVLSIFTNLGKNYDDGF